ncbi:MBL fold metallo-hydrolase [Halosolutus amylolyticus]|uniref:MBL fold metallo-hydrolase n=1 Tax=Halosolutus amylolyticus TaxID=2932267 RepID=A0ABD5PMB1_9EURY|nr:MBL fold metallo-hydrolase [Halosolutus amylolyticus]
MADVDRIAIGDGSPEGTNSAYVVGDRAVVDPGPPTDDAWAALREGLDRVGVAVDDLEYVLVTHWHVDHAGLAPRLAGAADATIAMGADDAPLVADYAVERERRLERDAETMHRLGIPDDVVANVIDGDAPSPMPNAVPVEPLGDGNRVAGIEALSTPGHTLGHTAYAVDDVLLVGDAILPTYTPNVGGSDTRTLSTQREGTTAEHDPLATFRETLDRLSNRSETLRPGHGTSLDSDRIDDVRTHHRDRSRRVLAALEATERGPTTPWTLARDLFGDLAGIHAKFGVGEAAAHLRSLERDGRVERVTIDPERYEPR